MAVILKCPECEGKFRWQFSEESKYPSHCLLCNAYMGIDRADDDIVMPSIRSMRTVLNDKLYRDMEKSSEVRMEKAAEMAGCSPAEMSGLKITDMQDGLREGDIAAMPVNNAVTQHMEAMNAKGGQLGFAPNGSEWSAGVASGAVTVNGNTVTGIAPRAGATAVGNVQRLNGRG